MDGSDSTVCALFNPVEMSTTVGGYGVSMPRGSSRAVSRAFSPSCLRMSRGARVPRESSAVCAKLIQFTIDW